VYKIVIINRQIEPVYAVCRSVLKIITELY